MARQDGPFTIDQRPPTARSGAREKERYQQKRFSILTGEPGIAWDVIDKTNSNLTDIETRNHNDLQFNRITVTADYTMLYTIDTVFADATGGAFTVYLPLIASAIGNSTVKKVDTSTNFVTVSGQSGQQVAGAVSFDLKERGESITVEDDGVEWWA